MKTFLYRNRMILAGLVAWGIGLFLVTTLLMLSGCTATKTVCVRKADQAYDYYVSKKIPVRYIHGYIRGYDIRGKRTIAFSPHAWVEYYDKKTDTWLLRDIGFGYRGYPREAYKVSGEPEYKFIKIIKQYKGDNNAKI